MSSVNTDETRTSGLRQMLRLRYTNENTLEDKHVARVVLVTTILCLIIYLFLGYPAYYKMMFGKTFFILNGLNPSSALYWYVNVYYNWGMTLILFLIIPMFVAHRLGIKNKDLGLQWGNKKIGFILFTIGIAVLPLIGLEVWGDQAMLTEYPLLHPFAEPTNFGLPAFNTGLWILGKASYIILYYIPYEFFWRGFAQFPLRQYGKINNFWIILWTTCLTSLIHLAVPITELDAAIVAGILYGWVALRTNSIYYGLIHHACTGLTTDFVSTIYHNQWIFN